MNCYNRPSEILQVDVLADPRDVKIDGRFVQELGESEMLEIVPFLGDGPHGLIHRIHHRGVPDRIHEYCCECLFGHPRLGDVPIIELDCPDLFQYVA